MKIQSVVKDEKFGPYDMFWLFSYSCTSEQ